MKFTLDQIESLAKMQLIDEARMEDHAKLAGDSYAPDAFAEALMDGTVLQGLLFSMMRHRWVSVLLATSGYAVDEDGVEYEMPTRHPDIRGIPCPNYTSLEQVRDALIEALAMHDSNTDRPKPGAHLFQTTRRAVRQYLVRFLRECEAAQ